MTHLRGYQSEAVRKATSYDGFALFPEQRTGKCLVSLTLIDRRKPNALLIICPKKAITVWQSQIEEHLSFDWECEVRIINFEACSRTTGARKKIRKWARKNIAAGTLFVLCDEAHRIKKRGTKQSRLVRTLGYLATWRLALTGTPIAQGSQDAWAIYDFIERGALEWKWEEFAEKYLKWGGYQGRKIVGYKNEEKFLEVFHRYSYRITFNEARRSEGLPAPRIRRRRVTFPLRPDSRRAYQELEKDLETYIRSHKISTPTLLNLTMKLQQLAGGFVIHEEQQPGQKKKREVIPVGREKIRRLKRLLQEPQLQSRRLVICARYKHELLRLGTLLDQLKLSHKSIKGGSEFDGIFDTDIILLQIASGIAFDLSSSNTYIFYSWDHSYINYEQSKFRVLAFHTKQVNYYYLIAEDTVDEEMYNAVKAKKDFANMICDKYRKRA